MMIINDKRSSTFVWCVKAKWQYKLCIRMMFILCKQYYGLDKH